ncbi:DUF6893 family small protein [Nonomuraea spiralis]|uniref:DUF6893 family small protein n=1 Tax=Nonomuraea spiralis TaxID=46182 RepID=A0ABV5IGR2_9ACTN
MRRPVVTLLAGLAGVVLLKMFWEELPSLKRYLKIRKM